MGKKRKTNKQTNSSYPSPQKNPKKLNIKKTKIMESYTIHSWQLDGETMETVTGFIF